MEEHVVISRQQIEQARQPIRLSIDVDALTVGDQMQLEKATTVTQLVDWFVKHAGADVEELQALPLREIRTLAEQVGRQLATGLAPSKSSGARS